MYPNRIAGSTPLSSKYASVVKLVEGTEMVCNGFFKLISLLSYRYYCGGAFFRKFVSQ
jgi:hypothetical protein